MKNKFLLLATLLLLLFNCGCKKGKKELTMDCYMGRIKLSKQHDCSCYNIYVSLKMVNNTKDTVYVPSYENLSYPNNFLSPSYFIGEIGEKEIHFETINQRSCIPPQDSIPIYLICQRYDSKTLDSTLFVNQIQNMKIKYKYKEENLNQLDYLKEVEIQRTSHTKFERLKDNVWIEGVFMFGNIEFE